MKTKLALLLALTLAVQLHGALINYEFGGTITSATFRGITDPGISVGDAFRLVLSLDDSTPNSNPSPPGIGRYVMLPLFTFTVGANIFSSQTGTSPRAIFWTARNPEFGDGLIYDLPFGMVATSWASQSAVAAVLTMTLANLAGHILASDAIPDQINLLDWPDQHTLHFGGGEDAYAFSITSNIDSIVRTPETASTLLLFSLALLPVLWWKRKLRRGLGGTFQNRARGGC